MYVGMYVLDGCIVCIVCMYCMHVLYVCMYVLYVCMYCMYVCMCGNSKNNNIVIHSIVRHVKLYLYGHSE